MGRGMTERRKISRLELGGGGVGWDGMDGTLED